MRVSRVHSVHMPHVHATCTCPEGHVERRSPPLPHLGREKAVPGLFFFLVLFF